jgi:hypothetical protein
MRKTEDDLTEVRLVSPSGKIIEMKMRKAPPLGKTIDLGGVLWTVTGKMFLLPSRRGTAA